MIKKYIGMLLLLPCVAIAQDAGPYSKTFSTYYSASSPSAIGISFEIAHPAKDSLGDNAYKSAFVNLGLAMMTYEVNDFAIDGKGFVVELGSRGYFNKEQRDLYIENMIGYSSVTFDKHFPANAIADAAHFKGRYSYVSLIAPAVGYKIIFGGGFSLDPSIGFNWKWEIKGEGDIDNKNTNNFVLKAGVKLGYSF